VQLCSSIALVGVGRRPMEGLVGRLTAPRLALAFPIALKVSCSFQILKLFLNSVQREKAKASKTLKMKS